MKNIKLIISKAIIWLYKKWELWLPTINWVLYKIFILTWGDLKVFKLKGCQVTKTCQHFPQVNFYKRQMRSSLEAVSF